MITLDSRFSSQFSLSTPIALAPMAFAGGGALAAACARAGAFGFVGGSYGDLDWVRREFSLALTEGPARRIGCGFIAWESGEDASALHWVLDQRPAAVLLSFGDPRPFGPRILASGATLFCQVQRLEQIPVALEAGAHVIVVQGAEAGGHGADAMNGRGTMSLVPESADWLAGHSPSTLLLAAGGIADGRGVAAARLLGADGVMMGTRFWASHESLATVRAKDEALGRSGDATARSRVFDIVRNKNWPVPYDLRALRNDLHRRWEYRIGELERFPHDARADYEAGLACQDYSKVQIPVGEGIGLAKELAGAADIIREVTQRARELLVPACGSAP